MKKTFFEVGKYKNKRWAVCAFPACVWYFPQKAGRAGAEELARRLNMEAVTWNI